MKTLCKIKCKNAKNSCKSSCVRCTETVTLHVTASGINSRRQLADEELPLTASDLQEKVADVAGVDKSLVTIAVTADNADNVLITATITVPASMTAADVMASLSFKLSTPDAASEALDIKVVAVPTVSITSSPSPPPPSPSQPTAAVLALDVTAAAEHVGSTVTLIGGAAAAVALLALLFFASRRVSSTPRPALATPRLGTWPVAPRSSRPHLTL